MFVFEDVANKGEDGMTPLHFAARFKRAKTITYTDDEGNEVIKYSANHEYL